MHAFLFAIGLLSEEYKQYFNKEIDLQCKRILQFGFEACYRSRFQQHPQIQFSFLYRNHCSSNYIDKLVILLLQLLYESQNKPLCQVLAQSMINHSLCLDEVRLSLFDRLCLSYFINNSNTSWNHLDLSSVNDQEVQILTNTLTNNSQQNQCKILQVKLYSTTDDSVYKLLKLSFLHNIQECYCKLYYIPIDLCLVILQLLNNLPLIKVLHLLTEYSESKDESTNSILHTDKYSELETCIAMNSTLLEMKLLFKSSNNPIVSQKTITSLINGVTRNKTITSFSLEVDPSISPLSEGTIEHLLKDNHTLQTLKLDIPDHALPSSLNIVEVNTPLTTLEIRERTSHKLSTSLLPHIKGLHCIKLYHTYQSHLLFHYHSSLQQLDKHLETSESIIELFTILQSNTTLKSLRVKIENNDVIDSMGTSLQNMLTLNQTIEYLEIEAVTSMKAISSKYLSFLTTGLLHNTSLQELSVFIPISVTNNEQIRTFFNVISQKNHLTELKLNFRPDQIFCDIYMKEESFFYEQIIPLVTNMLELHTTIRLLQIVYMSYGVVNKSNWIELMQHLLQSIFLHPSLEYVKIWYSKLLMDTYKAQKKSLIEQHKKLYPLKPLPIIIYI